MADRSGHVVTGMGVVTALGVGVPEVFDRLCAGDIGIRPITRYSPNTFATTVAAEVPDDVFRKLQSTMDVSGASRAEILALAAASEALGDAPNNPDTTALVLSTTKADFDEFERALSDPPSSTSNRFNPAVFADHLASRLGLGGPVYAVSYACSSGLVAIAHAMRVLDRNQASHALVLGVDTLTEFVLAGFSSLRALSAVPARPFDAARDGLSLGEGAGALLLTRASESDTPIAHILGAAVANDAEHITAPSREGRGLRRAIDQCVRRADRSTSAIGYINAHGTGTQFNDEMECQAISHEFDPANQPPLTSMKGNLGHTLGAAGVIEAALSIEAMRTETVPPSAGYAEHGVSKPLNIPTTPTHVPALDNVLCVKSGFGGINAAVLFGRA